MSPITLRVLDGADRGRVFEALQPPVTIGREEGNSIQLNDDRVSRFHVKIQEDHARLVLTDLESTNGTKVNGEDIQLRILRAGDMITVGRSVLLFGTRDEIADKLRRGRSRRPSNGPRSDSDVASRASHPFDARRGGSDRRRNDDEGSSSSGVVDDGSLEFDLNNGAGFFESSRQLGSPPELPERLSPGQAAQLSEVLEYLHVQLRQLLRSGRIEEDDGRVDVGVDRWQAMLDLQWQIAEYLRQIGHPE